MIKLSKFSSIIRKKKRRNIYKIKAQDQLIDATQNLGHKNFDCYN